MTTLNQRETEVLKSAYDNGFVGGPAYPHTAKCIHAQLATEKLLKLVYGTTTYSIYEITEHGREAVEAIREQVEYIGTPELTDDEIEIAKAEMDAFYGRTEDDESDYDAHIAAQERAFNDSLDQMEDEREAQEYFEEHGVEPGGTCLDCGRTDAGCTCNHESKLEAPAKPRPIKLTPDQKLALVLGMTYGEWGEMIEGTDSE